jgi:hypothetical protein
LLSNGVVGDAADGVAEGLLEVLDVLLVRGGDLVELVWEVLVYENREMVRWEEVPLAM